MKSPIIATFAWTLLLCACGSVSERRTMADADADAAAAALQPMTEDQKIEALINSLGEIPDAKFIRNGQPHSVQEAMSHLRSKWDYDRANIKTAQDFIDRLASGSSLTRRPYLIEFPDGTKTESRAWFMEKLEALKQ